MRALVIFLIFTQGTLAGELQNFCKQKEGKIYKWYKCPNSKLNLKITTCEYKNNYGEVEFVNGCSGPTGRYKKIFFASCVKHDLCYHHEPMTNNRSQKYCDKQLFDGLSKACSNHAKDIDKCKRRAKFMYFALRLIGKPAFYCENKYGRYEN